MLQVPLTLHYCTYFHAFACHMLRLLLLIANVTFCSAHYLIASMYSVFC